MSEKYLLPDELLDAISGGFFSYQGTVIDKIGKINRFGMEAETPQGKMFFGWNEKALDEFGHMFGIYEEKVTSARCDPNTEFRLEDYANKPCHMDK